MMQTTGSEEDSDSLLSGALNIVKDTIKTQKTQMKAHNTIFLLTLTSIDAKDVWDSITPNVPQDIGNLDAIYAKSQLLKMICLLNSLLESMNP